MGLKPLCFVIMPFSRKPDPAGGPDIDFDRVYEAAIRPAIEDAEMEPIRADEEKTGGIIHKPMFERLLLCDFAVADLTTANANVFYELGVRHAARPHTTLTLFAKYQPIPFDVGFLRSLPYELGAMNEFGEMEAKALRDAVADRLSVLRKTAASEAAADSPVFQLLTDWKPGEIAHLKTDVFRERVRLNEVSKLRLAAIRTKAKSRETFAAANEEIRAFRGEIGPMDALDAGTVVDLMLTYRALEDWNGMIGLFDEMPETLKRQVLVREQLGFAYNRRAGARKDPSDRAEALRILTEVADTHGPSSETLGLIGRIHKDEWKEALEAGDETVAAAHLGRAIDAYRRGYMSDLRDAYPGINLVTLLDIRGDEGSTIERDRLLPVVRFAVERRLDGKVPDYWDHATMLELCVLSKDREGAQRYLALSAVAIRELWEPATTANNLRMIERSRADRGEDTSWLWAIVDDLDKRS